MTDLPNPFSNSGATPSGGPDEAAASSRSHAPDAAAEIKQKLLEAIEDDYRFILDEQAFMAAIVYVPPAARPENFEQQMAALDALVESDAPPIFLQRTG